MPATRPNCLGPPLSASMWAEIQREVGGTLANAKTESRKAWCKFRRNFPQNGKDPSRGLSFSGPVSRILSGAIICLPGAFGPEWATMVALRPTWTSPGRVVGPVWPCTGRGLPGRRVAATPVRSYRTISPLPVRGSRVAAPSAVSFLWHFPAGFPGWALPTALPCGVRTFLEGFSLPPRSAQPAPGW